MKTKDKWAFDPELGKQEIIDRRVGKNELDTMQTLLAIVDAQDEYAALDPLGKGAREYARRFISSPGKHDGLYWPTTESEPSVPLGALVAEAAPPDIGHRLREASLPTNHTTVIISDFSRGRVSMRPEVSIPISSMAG